MELEKYFTPEALTRGWLLLLLVVALFSGLVALGAGLFAFIEGRYFNGHKRHDNPGRP